MNFKKLIAWIAVFFGFAFVGCGGSASNPGNGSQTVTITFTDGAPLAVAQLTGSGNFAPASVQGGKLTVVLPQGTTRYSIAYVCPPVTFLGTLNAENIIQATVQDGAAYSVSCSLTGPTGHATGSVNASVIAGATDVRICGAGGCSGSAGSVNASFDVMLPAGNNDVAAVAVDGSGNVLAVKIIRNQSVPGVVNGGNTILFSPSDATSTQPVSVTNIPSGFGSPAAVGIEYFTANGTRLIINNNSPSTYRALPAAATQSGDFYGYQANTNDAATHNQAIGTGQTTTSGGGAATIALPAPWAFSGPTAATFPVFTFNYSGFNGMTAIGSEAEISWATGASSFNAITVTATNSFQNGATMLAIPNLTSIPGFLAPAPSGTTVNWVAAITGGTLQQFAFFPRPPANGSFSFVQNRGTYTEP